jgi:predicted esterase
MSIVSSHAVRRVAFVCLVVATSLGTLFLSHAAAGTTEPAGTTVASGRVARGYESAHDKTLLDGDTRDHYEQAPTKVRFEGRDILAFPPTKDASKHPLSVVYLHGRNGRAENGCPWLRSGASELGWLVCPEAVEHEGSGTASWGDDVFKQSAVVSRAIHAAEAKGASSEPGVAVGFSQGSYVALDLVKTGLGHFKGLVLIAAPEAHPSAKKLHDAGVVRVALAAGSLDAAHAPLALDAKRLSSEGMETRFFDLGHVGHTYAAEDTAILREAIAWAGGIE